MIFCPKNSVNLCFSYSSGRRVKASKKVQKILSSVKNDYLSEKTNRTVFLAYTVHFLWKVYTPKWIFDRLFKHHPKFLSVTSHWQFVVDRPFLIKFWTVIEKKVSFFDFAFQKYAILSPKKPQKKKPHLVKKNIFFAQKKVEKKQNLFQKNKI